MTTTQMIVTRNEDGSHSPAYDDTWPQARQLEWYAATVALETDLRIEVREASPGSFRIVLRGPRTLTSCGGMSFREGWTFLDGVAATVQALKP